MNTLRPLKLALEGILDHFALAEVGIPYGLFRGRDDSCVAVASGFGHLYWPGRATYSGQQLRHRLSLYQGTPPRRVAVFDGARYDINDVSLHPTRRLAAVATGSYDGGYLFEGELLLWDWERGTRVSLLPENREATRCRFNENGTQLSVLLRPATEQDFPEQPFNTFLGCTFPLSQPLAAQALNSLVPSDPRDFGFDSGKRSTTNTDREVAKWAAVAGLAFEQRHRVWDVAWLDDNTVAAVHDHCRLEVWDTQGRRLLCEQGNGHGVQILHIPGSEHALVHVRHSGLVKDNWLERSELLLLDVTDLSVRSLRRFNAPFAFSLSRQGWLLGRHTRPRRSAAPPPGKDVLLDPTGAVVRRLDLGHYDCFNHFLRIDGEGCLYFLQGAPPTSYEHQNLCELEPETGHWRTCWPLAAGELASRHLMECAGCAAGSDLIALACRLHDPRGGADGYILGRQRQTGKVLWQHPIPGDVMALVYLEQQQVLAYALTDGTLGLLDAASGRLLDSTRVVAEGVNTVVLSLSARGQRLVAGTIDGRLLLFRVGR